jgi:hypothetical protein
LAKHNSHELGLGITKKRTYSTSDGKLALPTWGPALDSLREAVARPVLDLDGPESQGAWRILLNNPSLTILMPEPTFEELASEGIHPLAEDAGRLRQVFLTAVARPREEWRSDQTLSRERFAGVGLLTVAGVEHGPAARMAWLNAQWTSSTREYVSLLEPHYVRAGLTRDLQGRKVALVVDQDVNLPSSGNFFSSLVPVAAVVGVHLDVYLREATSHENVRRSLQADRPAFLVTIGTGAGMDAIVAQFRDSPAGMEPGRLSAVSPVAPLESVRERLVHIARVSGALQPIYTPPTTMVRMPITPTDCRHDGAYIYVKDGVTELWWTHDIAGHGGVVFKTYSLVSSELRFDADRDVNGEVILGKHKGDVRKKIMMAGMAPCNRTDKEPHATVHVAADAQGDIST